MHSIKQFFLILIACFLISASSFASLNAQEPCCGPITRNGQQLLRMLDQMNVEHRWLHKRHVNWETGLPDRPVSYAGPDSATHCSAFVAAVSKQLHIYILHPPQHEQRFLASAQVAWLKSSAGEKAGWHAIKSAKTAQTLANEGELVIIAYPSPNPKKPGHIAIVRPSLKSNTALKAEGPDITQVGKYNRNCWNARDGFSAHPSAWPNAPQYYTAHPDF